MARHGAPPNLQDLFTVRVSHIPAAVSDDDILQEFSRFGPIGDFYRPVLLQLQHHASAYAFVRYFHQEDAQSAVQAMDGQPVWEDVELSVALAEENSFFSEDTGHITNHRLAPPLRDHDSFDSSLPPSHYQVKRKVELQGLTECYTVRIDDLHPSITKEDLERVFSSFGEVARVYFPVDLAHHGAPRGFAFVRYVRESDARRAAAEMDGKNLLGVGRDISVRINFQRTYFSQNESPPPRPKKKGIVMHFDP